MLDSSDLDSISSYVSMVNENCGFCVTDYISVNRQNFDKESKSLSYFDCKGECHDRDENTKNLMIGEIEDVNEEEDAINREKYYFFDVFDDKAINSSITLYESELMIQDIMLVPDFEILLKIQQIKEGKHKIT